LPATTAVRFARDIASNTAHVMRRPGSGGAAAPGALDIKPPDELMEGPGQIA
jgi:hypothetical protein